jgi:transposase-like protein
MQTAEEERTMTADELSTTLAESTTAPVRPPDPEVVPQAKARQFSAEYKRRILDEADRCTRPGETGAMLRREGLYASTLSRWREQRARGQLQALSPQQRGRKVSPQAAVAAELAALRQENQRLQARLQQAEAIIEVQKKVSQLLGPAPTEPDGRS